MNDMYGYLLAASIGSLATGLLCTLLAKKDAQATERKTQIELSNQWHEAFSRGWSSSRDHYTRYYTEEQKLLVFGTPDATF